MDFVVEYIPPNGAHVGAFDMLAMALEDSQYVFNAFSLSSSDGSWIWIDVYRARVSRLLYKEQLDASIVPPRLAWSVVFCGRLRDLHCVLIDEGELE